MAEQGSVQPINGDFYGKDIVSVGQFKEEDVVMVMSEADAMRSMVQENGRSNLLSDLVMANLFYEPSTRTFLSFEAAAKRLGAATISTQGVEFSSISKGETLEDTIRTVERYADTIVLRHETEGAARIAADFSDRPIINGGDGVGEHPTQALLDMCTILDEFGPYGELKIAMVGDLKHGRTVHSLARLLTLHGHPKLYYVSPPELAMPEDIVAEIGPAVRQEEVQDLHDVIGEVDVVYMTRIQHERFASEEEYGRLKGSFVLDAESMKRAKGRSIVMHPLPRVDEIDPAVDDDSRARYFEEVENGMYVRMALLAMVHGRSIRSE
ncbi:MAG TPA: aspartate carbamoyltransferase [Candidatus Saccharimonadales bacterium]|nr:aspartate carbamoyltransferase [Candidatus Saccharimonadales bacterium]